MGQMNEKYLYIDFDGVLHPTHVEKGQLFCHMQSFASAIVGMTLKIVISSNWRIHEEIGYLRGLFPPSIQSHVVGCTGNPHTGKWSRWYEIKEHAAIHNVSCWVALDDMQTEFPSECKELILCDGGIGLQNKQLHQLVEWLRS